MSDFQFDTSGDVAAIPPVGDMSAFSYQWSDLSPFVQGYVEAMMQSSRTLTIAPERCICGMSRGWFVRIDERISEQPIKFSQGPDFRCPDCKRVADGIPCAFSDLAPETLARILEDCGRFVGKDSSKEQGESCWRVRNHPMGLFQEIYPDCPALTPYLGVDGRVYLREGPIA